MIYNKKNIMFILPDFMSINRNKILIDIYKKNPRITTPNSKIYSFYGTFPGCIWNGGRPDISNERFSIKEMKAIRDFYNNHGIKITFTFTNQLLDYEHLQDEYCNKILETFENGINEILVASEILEKYIREKYPKYKINKSITVAEGKINYDISKYNLVVLDKKMNRDFEYLKEFNVKDKVELLCDEVCYNDCPYTKEHYKEICMIQLGQIEHKKNFGSCRFKHMVPDCKFIANRNNLSKYYISPNEINKYADLGYKYFKLSGREKYNFIGLESIIKYLIKPEYQMDVRTYIMEYMNLEMKHEQKSFKQCFFD